MGPGVGVGGRQPETDADSAAEAASAQAVGTADPAQPDPVAPHVHQETICRGVPLSPLILKESVLSRGAIPWKMKTSAVRRARKLEMFPHLEQLLLTSCLLSNADMQSDAKHLFPSTLINTERLHA